MNIHDRMQALGLNVLSYTNKATPADAEGRSYWIPRDAIGVDGKSAILFRPADADRRDLPGALYGFDGWEPCCAGMFGGRCATFESALAWMEQHHDPR